MQTRFNVSPKPAQPKNNPANLIEQFRTVMAPNWTPLEKLLPADRCADFMFMGSVVGVYLYKHIDTRRYLNIDSAGVCYAFNPNTSNYDPIPVATALEAVKR